MCRLGLIPALIALPALLIGCTQVNPAFTDCEATDCPDGDSTDVPGDGDGDGDGTNPGDGDTTDPGDGDPEGLPTCPDSTEVVIRVEQDTFLDGTTNVSNPQACVIDWDYEQGGPVYGEGPCAYLDFGGTPAHWACRSDQCNSTWLGQFAVWELEEDQPKILEAHFLFTAKVMNGESAQVSLYEFHPGVDQFDLCEEWMAGSGDAEPADDCVTTYAHAATPFPWFAQLPPVNLDPNTAISSVYAPSILEADYHELIMPVAPTLVQGWINGGQEHTGLLLQSTAYLPEEFNLLAQGSEFPPVLVVEACAMP